MRYDILNENGEIENVILASQDFVESQYPDRWRLSVYQYPEPNANNFIQEEIDRLEQEQLLSRPVRDFMLETMKDAAKKLGLTEEQLIAKNTLYRRVKQFDEQIAELREQL